MANCNYISTKCSGYITTDCSGELILPEYKLPPLPIIHKPIEHPHIHPEGSIQKEANGIWDLSFYDNGFNVIRK